MFLITIPEIEVDVSPLRGEWIEMFGFWNNDHLEVVSPLRGEWIEM